MQIALEKFSHLDKMGLMLDAVYNLYIYIIYMRWIGTLYIFLKDVMGMDGRQKSTPFLGNTAE